MVKRRLVQTAVVGGFILFGLAAPAAAQQNTAYPGASNSADYQPPTGNPQNNVGSVSQGQSEPSNLQTPGAVNQTDLPRVNDLRVPGVTSEPNTNTTKAERITENKQAVSTWFLILLGGVLIAVVVYFVAAESSKRSKRQAKTDEDTSAKKREIKPVVPASKPADVESTPSQISKPATSKKTTKRKKGKNNKKAKRKR